MAEEEAIQIRLDPERFSQVLRDIKGFDAKMSTGLRRQVRTAGKILLDAVAAEIRTYPAARYQTGMREQLAGSLAVRVNTTAGSSRQGVLIASTGRLLPANKKNLVKAMNKTNIRHPVFAGKTSKSGRQWVDQPGMRYFRQSIAAAHESEVIRLITEAVEEAAKALEGSK